MHSFTSCLMHCVFATKERRPLITPDLQGRLSPYLAPIHVDFLVVIGQDFHQLGYHTAADGDTAG